MARKVLMNYQIPFVNINNYSILYVYNKYITVICVRSRVQEQRIRRI